MGVNAEQLSNATNAMQALVDDKKIAGGVMMVSRRGKVVLAKAVGLGRVECNQPMQLDSIFRIYSMSKAITSIAAMQLVEENKLGLDAPISRYMPEFASVRIYDESTGIARKRSPANARIPHSGQRCRRWPDRGNAEKGWQVRS